MRFPAKSPSSPPGGLIGMIIFIILRLWTVHFAAILVFSLVHINSYTIS